MKVSQLVSALQKEEQDKEVEVVMRDPETTKYMKTHKLESISYSGMSDVVFLEIKPWGNYENYNGVLPPDVSDFVADLCSNPEKAREFLQRAGILERKSNG